MLILKMADEIAVIASSMPAATAIFRMIWCIFHRSG